jgi:hypothetical protein
VRDGFVFVLLVALGVVLGPPVGMLLVVTLDNASDPVAWCPLVAVVLLFALAFRVARASDRRAAVEARRTR